MGILRHFLDQCYTYFGVRLYFGLFLLVSLTAELKILIFFNFRVYELVLVFMVRVRFMS